MGFATPSIPPDCLGISDQGIPPIDQLCPDLVAICHELVDSRKEMGTDCLTNFRRGERELKDLEREAEDAERIMEAQDR